MRSYVSSLMTFSRAARIFLKKRANLMAILFVMGAYFFLLIVTIYSAVHANYKVSINSDDLIFPYLFKDFARHNIVLASEHSNILMFPLFYLQSVLPYNYTTFTIVNIGLDVITVLWTAYLLGKIFGKRYIILICIVLACILVGSTSLMTNITGSTIRNIEYPLSLALILFINNMLKQKASRKRNLILGTLVSVLFACAVAGDSLLLYAVILPMLSVLGLYWLQSRKFTKPMWKVLWVLIGIMVLSLIVKKLLRMTGAVSFFIDPTFQPHTIPANQLSFSITTTLKQILDLHNADIFNLSTLSPSEVIVFTNFAILLVGVLGLLTMLWRVGRDYYKEKGITENYSFVIGTLCLSFVIIPLVYILAGQAVHVLADGTLASSDQERYLTLLPFLTVVGFVLFMRQYYDRHKSLLLLMPIAIILIMIASIGFVRSEQNVDTARVVAVESSADTAISVSHKNNVQLLLTGYWYEMPIRFRSHDTVQATSVGYCNTVQPQDNTRLSWYTPSAGVHGSALLVDRSGPDASFWNCSDDELQSIYGKPYKVVYIDGSNATSGRVKAANDNKLQMWFYKYDLRTKVTKANFNKTLGANFQ